MAKKVNFKQIKEDLLKFYEQYYKLNTIKIQTKNVSIGIVNNNTQLILNHYLPLIIILCLKYYELENINDKILKENQNILEYILEEYNKGFKKELEKPHIIKEAQKLMCKIFKIDLTKKEFLAKDFIQFDDMSNEKYHNEAFGDHPPNKRNKNNMMLKMNSTGSEATHIRFGIYITKYTNIECNIEFRDLVTKN